MLLSLHILSHLFLFYDIVTTNFLAPSAFIKYLVNQKKKKRKGKEKNVGDKAKLKNKSSQ